MQVPAAHAWTVFLERRPTLLFCYRDPEGDEGRHDWWDPSTSAAGALCLVLHCLVSHSYCMVVLEGMVLHPASLLRLDVVASVHQHFRPVQGNLHPQPLVFDWDKPLVLSSLEALRALTSRAKGQIEWLRKARLLRSSRSTDIHLIATVPKT